MPIPSLDVDQAESLPLWAQVLLASRITRRAILGIMADAPKGTRDMLLAVCNAVDEVAFAGDGLSRHRVALTLAKHWRPRNEDVPLAEAVAWVIDAALAAEGAQDFPVDATVTADLHRCLHSLVNDRRVNAIQLATLFTADVDQMAFACKEIYVGKYNGLGTHVRGRLAPVHPLTITPVRRTAEEEAR